MTQKIHASTTNSTCDAENRMTAVSGAAAATFVYDGDGNRVKGVVGGVTTTYIGNYFEWTGSASTMKKYYYAGGTRVAEREGSTLYWLLGDHLGSTSITAYSSGGKKAEVRYKAWGETRYTYGTTPTSQRYTGQREEASLGLYWYNSRWYSPGLSRFISPDSIIPQPGSPLAWDRYSYVHSNPINGIDPSGHMPVQGCGDEGKSACVETDPAKLADNAKKTAQVLHEFEQNNCRSGNYAYCSGWTNKTKPISGIHVGWSGQVGLIVEPGGYYQRDYVVDWKNGAVYEVITVGGSIYAGTPTGIEGTVYFGTSNVYGIPAYAGEEQIISYLAGPQVDVSGSINIDAGLLAGVEKGFSIDWDTNKNSPVYTDYIGYMYTTETSIQIGGNALPNFLDVNIEGGGSQSIYVRKVADLW